MGAQEPQELHELFAKYYNSRDLDGLLSLYEEDASLVIGPEQVVSGHEAIRLAFQAIFPLNPTIEFVGTEAVFISSDLALTHARWLQRVEGIDDIEAQTAEVARRQPDGSWKYVIDNPTGDAVIG